jgi:hypothetical protein
MIKMPLLRSVATSTTPSPSSTSPGFWRYPAAPQSGLLWLKRTRSPHNDAAFSAIRRRPILGRCNDCSLLVLPRLDKTGKGLEPEFLLTRRRSGVEYLRCHMQKPQGYALGSMIQAANSGAIRIMAHRTVFRRYVLADELLAVGIADGGVEPATLGSGGELVEMAELAPRIASVVHPDAVISREEINPHDADHYHSDGQDSERRCRTWDLASAPLACQIEVSARGVLGRA